MKQQTHGELRLIVLNLKNIIPPAEIQDAMEKQMKAERERRETDSIEQKVRRSLQS